MSDRDAKAAEACAKVLQSLGFVVEATSARGVTFAGPRALFEQAFEQVVDLEPAPHFVAEPRMPANCERAESVYFPTNPIRFR